MEALDYRVAEQEENVRNLREELTAVESDNMRLKQTVSSRSGGSVF